MTACVPFVGVPVASRFRSWLSAGAKCLAGGVLLLGLTRTGLAAGEPFMDICVNVSNVLALVEDKMPTGVVASAGAAGAKVDSLKQVKALKMGAVHLFMYPDKEYKVAPVLYTEHIAPGAVVPLLADGGPYAAHFEKERDGVYKFKEPPPPAADADDNAGAAEGGSDEDDEGGSDEDDGGGAEAEEAKSMPLELYRLWVSSKGAVIAPVSIVQTWTNGQRRPLASPVAGLCPSATNADLLVAFSVILPSPPATNWVGELSDSPLLNLGPAGDAFAFGSKFLEELTAPLRQTKSIAFSLCLKKDKTRIVSYVQSFRAQVDAAMAMARLKGGAVSNESGGLVSALVDMANDKAVKSEVSLQADNSVRVYAAWAPTNDEQVVGHLMGAVMQMMMGGDGMFSVKSSGDGAVGTNYVSAPKLEETVDLAALQADLTRQLSTKLFAGHYWGSGDSPKVRVECDYLSFPNAELSEIRCDVVEATAPDGSSVLRKGEDGGEQLWNCPDGTSGQIAVPVAKGTQAELLDKAKLRFSFQVPTRLAVFDVAAGDVGKKLEKNGCSITVKELGGHSVSVAFGGGAVAKVFARDTSGQYLRQRCASWGGTFVSATFDGDPVAAKVAVVAKQETVPVEVSVDLLKGKGVVFPSEPSDAVPARYAAEGTTVPAAYSKVQVDAWKVEWEKVAKGREFEGNLRVSLPGDRFDGELAWKVDYFGKDKPLALRGNGGGLGASLYYYPHDCKDAVIHGAHGYLDVTVAEALATVDFDHPGGTSAVVRVTAGGTKVGAAFDKNHVRVGFPRARILRLQAMDGSGQMLKQEGSRDYNEGVTYRFWGQPKSVRVIVADSQVKRRIPIDLTREGIDLQAYELFKKRLAALSDAVTTLKAIRAAIGTNGRAYSHDDTLAGYHYLLDEAGKPFRFIDEAVAQSDPAGQARYGYPVKPHNGYYFTVAKGEMRDGKPVPYARRGVSQERKWAKGAFVFDPLAVRPALIAVPVDKGGASVFVSSWGRIHYRFLDGATLDYVPGGFAEGWAEAE